MSGLLTHRKASYKPWMSGTGDLPDCRAELSAARLSWQVDVRPKEMVARQDDASKPQGPL